MFYGPAEESTAEPQEQQDQLLPSQYDPDAYYNTVQTSAPRQIDCFTIALGKKTGTTFPITFNNNQNYNALYDTGAGASLINYSAYVSLGRPQHWIPTICQEHIRRRHGHSWPSHLFLYNK